MTDEQFNDAMMACHFQSQSMAAEAERQLFTLATIIERQAYDPVMKVNHAPAHASDHELR